MRFVPPERAYALWSATYDQTPNPMIALVEQSLGSMLLGRRVDSVAELGCGTGRNLALMASMAGATTLLGCDLSPLMLSHARQRVPQARLWTQDLLSPLPGDLSAVDLVLVSLVLEHLEDVAPVFAHAAGLVRPGGEVMVLEIHPTLMDRGSRARFEAQGEVLMTASWRHDQAELEAAASAAGLGEGAFEDVVPSAQNAARFTSSRRLPGAPWLLVGRWVLPDA